MHWYIMALLFLYIKLGCSSVKAKKKDLEFVQGDDEQTTIY
jgi:hypothetical protein